MAAFLLGLVTLLASCEFHLAVCFCVTGCSCTEDKFGRSLLCIEGALGSVPQNIPGDFIKIRIENSHLSELHQRAFATTSALESLWLNLNEIIVMNVKSLEGLRNLTELRLQQNKLRSIPWRAFQDTPRLKILDLKHNRLDMLPENSLHHLPALTYLDLSFNQLTVISSDVFLNSPQYHPQTHGRRIEGGTNVLALHDNQWLCDCRLKDFVEYVKSISPPLILINPYLTCSGPNSKAGKSFHALELKTCLKPETTTSQANVTLPLGATTTLTCLVKARPDPMVKWSYSLKTTRGFTVSQLQVSEDTISTALTIPSVHLTDQGFYTCTANNFIGTSSVAIQLNVLSSNTSFPMLPASPVASVEGNVSITLRIAKQTADDITVEWNAVTESPIGMWFTVHFGRYDSQKKEKLYVGPGINSYSVNDLLPATKYEVCVSFMNQPAQQKQCITFITRSSFNEVEQRERLIHIIVIVCVMVLAVTTGMYACVTDTRVSCFDRCARVCARSRRDEKDMKRNRQGPFDNLQAVGDEELCSYSGDENKMTESVKQCK